MSTRSLFVLVLAMVLGIALSVRWYLEAEGVVHAGARPATWTAPGEAAAATFPAAMQVESRQASRAPGREVAPPASNGESLQLRSTCSKRQPAPESVHASPPEPAPATAASSFQPLTGIDAL